MLKWFLIPLTVVVVVWIIQTFIKWIKKREKKEE